MDTRHDMNNIDSAIQALAEKKLLITKSFLKKYGDKSKLIFYPQKRNKKDLVGLLFVGKVRANQVLDLEYNIDDYNLSFFDYIIKLLGVPEEDNIENSINSIINFKLKSDPVDNHIKQTCTCNILNNSAKCNAQTCLYNEYWSLYVEITELSQFEIEVIDATNLNLDVIVLDKFDIFYIKDRKENECELTSVAIFCDIKKTETPTDGGILFTYSSVLKEIVPIIYDYKEKDFKFILKPKFFEEYALKISENNLYYFKSDLAELYNLCEEYYNFHKIQIESELNPHTIMPLEESNIIKFKDHGFKYNLILDNDLNTSHSYDNNRELQGQVNAITYDSIGSGEEKTFWPGNIHFNNLPIDYLTLLDQSSRSIVSRFSEHAKSTTFLDNDLKLTNNFETKSLTCTIGDKISDDVIVNYSLHTTILEDAPTIKKNKEAKQTYITVGHKDSNGVTIPLVLYTKILELNPLLDTCNKSADVNEYGIYTSEVYTTIGNKQSNSIIIPYSEEAGYVKTAIKFSEDVICKYEESDGILSKLDEEGNEIVTTTNIIDGVFEMNAPRFQGVQVTRHLNVPENLNEFFTHLQLEDSKTGLIKTIYKDKSLYDIPLELVQDDLCFRIDFNKRTDESGTINLLSDLWDKICESEGVLEYLPGTLIPNYNIDDIFSINNYSFEHKTEKFLYFDLKNEDIWKSVRYELTGLLLGNTYVRGRFDIYFNNKKMFSILAGGETTGTSGVSNLYVIITPILYFWQNATLRTVDDVSLNSGFEYNDNSTGTVTIKYTLDDDAEYKLDSSMPSDWFKLSNYFSDAYKLFFLDTFGTDPFYITTAKKQVILGSDGLLISDGKTLWKNGVVTTIS